MTSTFFARLNRTALALIVTTSAILATACAGGGNPSAPSPGDGSPSAPSTGGSSGTSGGSQASVAGTYQLVTVNGKSVPCVFDSYSPAAGVTLTMRAMRGIVILNADGTYTQEYEAQLSGSNMKNDVVTTNHVVGTYTIQGSTLTLSPVGGQPFTPTFAAGVIEIVAEAPALDGGKDQVTFTFRK